MFIVVVGGSWLSGTSEATCGPSDTPRSPSNRGERSRKPLSDLHRGRIKQRETEPVCVLCVCVLLLMLTGSCIVCFWMNMKIMWCKIRILRSFWLNLLYFSAFQLILNEMFNFMTVEFFFFFLQKKLWNKIVSNPFMWIINLDHSKKLLAVTEYWQIKLIFLCFEVKHKWK